MDNENEDETHPINPPMISGIAFFIGLCSSIIFALRDDLGFTGFMMMFMVTSMISVAVYLLTRFLQHTSGNRSE